MKTEKTWTETESSKGQICSIYMCGGLPNVRLWIDGSDGQVIGESRKTRRGAWRRVFEGSNRDGVPTPDQINALR
jgi:hypothetical protein